MREVVVMNQMTAVMMIVNLQSPKTLHLKIKKHKLSIRLGFNNKNKKKSKRMIVTQTVNQMIQMNHQKIAKMMKTVSLLAMRTKKNLEKMKNMKLLKDMKKEWRMNKKNILKIKWTLIKQK
jgi:hypothetical protein